MIHEGDKVTLPTEPGVVQTVDRGVTADCEVVTAPTMCIRGRSITLDEFAERYL